MPQNGSRLQQICAALAVALAALLAASDCGAAGDTVSFDAARTHRFDGFGVNLFLAPSTTDPRDALLRDLHTRFAEINLSQKLPDTAFDVPRTAAEFAQRMIAAESPDDGARVDRFRDEMQALGIALHFVYRRYPEPWLDRFGAHNGHPEWRLRPEHIADIARWITGQLLWAAHHGIAPAAIEIAGEPDGSWNALVTPAQFVALLVATRGAMDAAGLHAVGIEGPGTSKVWTAPRYLDAIQGGGHLGLLTAITLHDYDTLRFPPPAGLAALAPDLRSQLRGLPIAVTEFGVEGNRWSEPPYDVGPEHRGGQDPATASDAYGVAMAAEALRLISDGAASIYVWELEDHPWEDLSMGLLDLQGQRRPAAAALQSFLSRVPAGSPAVPAQGAGPGLGAAAFLTEDGPLFVLANLDPAPHPLELRLANFKPAPAALAPLIAFPPGAATSPVPIVAGEARLELPPNSVLVLGVR